MAQISIDKLSFKYKKSEQYSLKNINMSIKKGEFIILCGSSGCGKTTLLKQLKIPPIGEKTGDAFYNEKNIEEIDKTVLATDIGYLFQHPDHQIVTDKVWHELAFGLENLAMPAEEIRLRVSEIAQYFGIHNWYDKKTSELSGGQKQLLNLASILVMQPKVLLLDEPTAQLDPIAREQFLDTLVRINHDLGITIIMSEHNLQQAISICDRVIVMQNGEIIDDTTPLKLKEPFSLLPTPMKIVQSVSKDEISPLTIQQGRLWLEKHAIKTEFDFKRRELNEEFAIDAKGIYFKYDQKSVLEDFSIKVTKGSIYSILGGNGSGKSTALQIISKIIKPFKGKINSSGSVGLLVQDPQSVFTSNSVIEELDSADKNNRDIIKLCKLESFLDRHPYDLSVGEQQRTALAKMLLVDPEILILDEPVKGLDAEFQAVVGEILLKLSKQGKTIIMASHNLEFCARYSDVCGLLFNGKIVSENEPHEFFAANNYFTTSANKMARDINKKAVLWEEVVQLCQ